MTWRELRIAIRSLRRAPGFAVTGILTLAVAIGMTTSVFTVADALLLRPLPYKNAGRLAMIWNSSVDGGRGPVSFDDFEDWRRNSKTIESAALFSSYYKPTLSGAGQAERLSGLLVSHQYFTVMGAQPLLGRFFRPEEDRDGHDDVVVLSYQLWRNRFQADPHVIGRTLLLNARPHVILGVAGPDLPLLPPSLADEPAQIYRPVGEPFDSGSRDGRHLESIVRLRPGISVAQAQAELDVRCRQMQRQYPKADAHLAARIVGLRADLAHNTRPAMLSLQGAVLLLLLIACANIANLLLAKSNARRHEMAVRSALGATSRQLARMVLSESLVLGLAGGLCGLVLAWWSTAAFAAVAARVLPDAASISVNGPVLIFAILLSLAASLTFGIAPITQLRSRHVDNALKSGMRVAGDRRHGLRQSLAAGQIALALLLLVGVGLLGKSFLRLRAVDPGFDPQSVLAASISLPQVRYPDDASVIQFFERTLARLRALPGVREAAIVSVVPMSGDFDRTGFVIRGKTFGAGEQKNPDRYIVSPGYFRALRVPLRQGRLFDGRDDPQHPPVCVINETAARLWFAGESPLGQKIRAGSASGGFDNSPFREVVGVVGDVAQYALNLPTTPQIYMPHAQYASRFLTFVVRTGADPSTFAGALQKAVFAIDPEQPVYNVEPLEQIVSNTIAARRLGVWLLGVFALCALTLASVGVYAVVAYSVAQRTAEFGIRKALGARSGDILSEGLRSSMPMIVAGLLGGIAGSLALSKLVARFLYSVSATDAFTFAVLPLLLGVIATGACYLPAWRAARIDPVIALRHE
jgi:putative ABC transport system permease protein